MGSGRVIWRAKELEEALSVQLLLSQKSLESSKIEINSKDVEEGDIFIALDIGSRDGHIFVQDALNHGASCAIVSKSIKDVNPNFLIRVEDSFLALKKLALYKRKNSKALFIGISGSYGKTTTKNIFKFVLSKFGRVFASRKNFNNYLGILINLASIDLDVKYSVIEMGISKKNEILSYSEIVRPDIVVLTGIKPAHLENFGSLKDLTHAKCELLRSINPLSGIALLNKNIKYTNIIQDYIRSLAIKNVFFFGRSKTSAEVVFDSYYFSESFVRFVYFIGGTKYCFSRSYIAEYFGDNFAIILLFAYIMKLDIEKVILYLKEFIPNIGRGKILTVHTENKKHLLICDYYNSNPYALKQSLKSLSYMTGFKVAILGDMNELGKHSVKYHLEMIPYIKSSGVKIVILIGNLFRQVYLKFNCNTEIQSYTYDHVGNFINDFDKIITKDSIILLKASRSLHFENIVRYFGVRDVL